MLSNKISGERNLFENRMLVITTGGFPAKLKLKNQNTLSVLINRKDGTIDISFDSQYINCSCYSMSKYYQSDKQENSQSNEVLEVEAPNSVKEIFLATLTYTASIKLFKKVVKIKYWKEGSFREVKYCGVPKELFSGRYFKMTFEDGGKVLL